MTSQTTWLKPTEVAKRLGISRRQAYYLISRGDIPSVRFSANTTRIDAQAVDNYIEARRRDHAPTR